MRVLILGGGYAGVLCAVRLARQVGERVEVTLVSAGEAFVDRIRLHQRAAAQTLPVRRLDAMLAGTGVRLRIGRIEAIDPRGEVTVDGEQLGFDKLVIALGSCIDTEAVPGVREHAYTLEAARAAELAERAPVIAARRGHVVVVGGGLTGVEGASELAESFPGLRVTLLAGAGLVPELPERAQAYLRARLTKLGVRVEEGGGVRRVTTRGVELDGRTLPCDACLWAGGFVASPLPARAGLPVNVRGQVLVDPCLRVLGHAHVYAAGDVAELERPPSRMVMGCKTALPMAAHVADNLARLVRGDAERPFDYLDTLFCLSLGRRDGLVQPVRGDGSWARWMITGRAAAWVKELICAAVPWAIDAERRGRLRFRWRKTGRVRALAAAQVERLAA